MLCRNPLEKREGPQASQRATKTVQETAAAPLRTGQRDGKEGMRSRSYTGRDMAEGEESR